MPIGELNHLRRKESEHQTCLVSDFGDSQNDFVEQHIDCVAVSIIVTCASSRFPCLSR